MPTITANGVDLFYDLRGPADAPVVAFANSIGSTLEMWDAQAAALAGRYRCLRYDARGHGRSATVDASACWRRWASAGRMSSASRSAA